MSVELSVSIVLYRPDARLLASTLSSLAAAATSSGAAGGQARVLRLFLVDNDPRATATTAGVTATTAGASATTEAVGCGARWVRPGAPIEIVVVSGHGNLGFGRAHNLALQAPAGLGRYHLVLNPDVELAADALVEALAFMDAHPQCGLLSPVARDGQGGRVSLCKRYPSVLVLLLRGFAPRWLRTASRQRLDAYEMRELPEDLVVWDPPIVSGCFMLFRSEVLKRLGGFDPRFFLYFEDFDLSLRAGRITRIARVPSVRVVHHGGGAARKGLAHVRMFVASMARFFGKHGWRWV